MNYRLEVLADDERREYTYNSLDRLVIGWYRQVKDGNEVLGVVKVENRLGAQSNVVEFLEPDKVYKFEEMIYDLFSALENNGFEDNEVNGRMFYQSGGYISPPNPGVIRFHNDEN